MTTKAASDEAGRARFRATRFCRPGHPDARRIGVNTVAFNAVNALILKPFKLDDADRVGWIRSAYGQATVDEFEALGRSTTTFDSIAAEGRLPVTLQTAAGARQAWSAAVSANYLNTVEARPEMGRVFTPVDLSESDLPVVVSHRFWQETLGSPSSVAGLTLVINGRHFSVVGVLPDDFQGRGGLFAPDMWLPLERTNVLNVPQHCGDDPALLFGALQDQLRSVDRNLPGTMATMTERMKLPLWPARTAAGFFLICGILALVLATVGLFGVLYFTVQQRTREFGIRVALARRLGAW
ncbi:MAG: ABC transporter permease [Vicinamibacterales bacterium]